MVVVSRLPSVRSRVMYSCRCDCGTPVAVRGESLRSGHTESCGCGKSAALVARLTKHGSNRRGGRSPAYSSWSSMIQRCTNPRDKAYPSYGGRGIKVPDTWLEFTGFYADMGDRPEGSSLERKKNNAPYSKENCIWATRQQQQSNTRACRYITYGGRTQTMAAWARETGRSPATIRRRLDSGLSVAEILVELPPLSPLEEEAEQLAVAMVEDQPDPPALPPADDTPW